MEYIHIGALRYACPFASEFAKLTEDEEAYLRQSIGDLGIVNEVVVYESPEHGRAVVQGRNRVRIASLLGLPVPLRDMGKLSDEDAKRLALDLQAAGRQLSVAQAEQARRKRIWSADDQLRRRIEELRHQPAIPGIETTFIEEEKRKDEEAGGREEESEDAEDDEDEPIVVDPKDAARQEAADAVSRIEAYLIQVSEDLKLLLDGPAGSGIRRRAKAAGQAIPERGVWEPIKVIRKVVGV